MTVATSSDSPVLRYVDDDGTFSIGLSPIVYSEEFPASV
jgi:hypothetical protein